MRSAMQWVFWLAVFLANHLRLPSLGDALATATEALPAVVNYTEFVDVTAQYGDVTEKDVFQNDVADENSTLGPTAFGSSEILEGVKEVVNSTAHDRPISSNRTISFLANPSTTEVNSRRVSPNDSIPTTKSGITVQTAQQPLQTADPVVTSSNFITDVLGSRVSTYLTGDSRANPTDQSVRPTSISPVPEPKSWTTTLRVESSLEHISARFGDAHEVTESARDNGPVKTAAKTLRPDAFDSGLTVLPTYTHAAAIGVPETTTATTTRAVAPRAATAAAARKETTTDINVADEIEDDSQEETAYERSLRTRRVINHAALWITIGFVVVLVSYITVLVIYNRMRPDWQDLQQPYSRFENEPEDPDDLDPDDHNADCENQDLIQHFPEQQNRRDFSQCVDSRDFPPCDDQHEYLLYEDPTYVDADTCEDFTYRDQC